MKKIMIGLAGILCSLPACAELLTFQYTGVMNFLTETKTVTSYGGRSVAASSLAPVELKVGDKFTGTFTYDTAVAETPGPYTTIKYFNFFNESTLAVPAMSLSLTRTGFTFSTVRAPYLIVYGADKLNEFNLGASLGPNSSLQFKLAEYSGTSLAGAAIPRNLELDDFGSAYVDFFWANTNLDKGLEAQGMLTSLSLVTSVPEPSTYLMLLTGLALVAGGTRRQRANTPA